MRDPLVVERDVLQLLGRIERLCNRLRDVDAEASVPSPEELQRLRRLLLEAQSRSKRRRAWKAALGLFRVVAEAVVKAIIEAQKCFFSACIAANHKWTLELHYANFEKLQVSSNASSRRASGSPRRCSRWLRRVSASPPFRFCAA